LQYAWPFDVHVIAKTLLLQVKQFS